MEYRAWLMAIDPSITGTAVVVLGKDLLVRKEYSTKKTEVSKTLRGRMRRYNSIARNVENLAKEHNPEMLFIEGYSYGSSGKNTIDLGEFGGVLRFIIEPYFDDCLEVPPSMIKKFVTGSGVASKAAVVSAVTQRYRVICSSDNQADAFALAQFGACFMGKAYPINKNQEVLLSNLEKLKRSTSCRGL